MCTVIDLIYTNLVENQDYQLSNRIKGVYEHTHLESFVCEYLDRRNVDLLTNNAVTAILVLCRSLAEASYHQNNTRYLLDNNHNVKTCITMINDLYFVTDLDWYVDRYDLSDQMIELSNLVKHDMIVTSPEIICHLMVVRELGQERLFDDRYAALLSMVNVLLLSWSVYADPIGCRMSELCCVICQIACSYHNFAIGHSNKAARLINAKFELKNPDRYDSIKLTVMRSIHQLLQSEQLMRYLSSSSNIQTIHQYMKTRKFDNMNIQSIPAYNVRLTGLYENSIINVRSYRPVITIRDGRVKVSIVKDVATSKLYVSKVREFGMSLSLELSILKRLKSGYICNIEEIDLSDCLSCQLVLEYGGLTVKQYLDLNPNDDFNHKSLSLELCRAIKHVNSFGIIHSDIKPDNVIISMNHARTAYTKVRLIDFDTSNIMFTLTRAFNHVAQTFEFRSPEILSYQKRCWSFKIDVWGAGCVMYYLHNRNLPWRHNTYDLFELTEAELLDIIEKKDLSTQPDHIRKSLEIEPNNRSSILQLELMLMEYLESV